AAFGEFVCVNDINCPHLKIIPTGGAAVVRNNLDLFFRHSTKGLSDRESGADFRVEPFKYLTIRSYVDLPLYFFRLYLSYEDGVGLPIRLAWRPTSDARAFENVAAQTEEQR